MAMGTEKSLSEWWDAVPEGGGVKDKAEHLARQPARVAAAGANTGRPGGEAALRAWMPRSLK